jgi:hypothetical protein
MCTWAGTITGSRTNGGWKPRPRCERNVIKCQLTKYL